MTHLEEHLRDCHCDTWQQMEAEQFLKDERDSAEYDMEQDRKDWEAAGCPKYEPPVPPKADDGCPF